MRRKLIISLYVGMGMAVFFAGSLQASIWYEASGPFGEAGESLGSAHVVVGSGALTQIIGVNYGPDDADLYAIWISNPASFSAVSTGGISYGGGRPSLYLFDSAGYGVMGYVDWTNSGALLDNSGLIFTSPGLYYLAFTSGGASMKAPVDSVSNPIWTIVYNWILPANGPGAANPLAGWSLTPLFYSPTEYTITLTGAAFVPEPATLLVLLLGGLVFRCRMGGGR